MIDYVTEECVNYAGHISPWSTGDGSARGVFDSWERGPRTMYNLQVEEKSSCYPVVLFISGRVPRETSREVIDRLMYRIRSKDKQPLILIYSPSVASICKTYAETSAVYGLPSGLCSATRFLDAKLDIETRVLLADGSPSAFLTFPRNFARKYLRMHSAKKYPIVPPVYYEGLRSLNIGGRRKIGEKEGFTESNGHKTGFHTPEGWYD